MRLVISRVIAGTPNLFLTLALRSGKFRFATDKLRMVSSGSDRNRLRQLELARGSRRTAGYPLAS